MKLKESMCSLTDKLSTDLEHGVVILYKKYIRLHSNNMFCTLHIKTATSAVNTQDYVMSDLMSLNHILFLVIK